MGVDRVGEPGVARHHGGIVGAASSEVVAARGMRGLLLDDDERRAAARALREIGDMPVAQQPVLRVEDRVPADHHAVAQLQRADPRRRPEMREQPEVVGHGDAPGAAQGTTTSPATIGSPAESRLMFSKMRRTEGSKLSAAIAARWGVVTMFGIPSSVLSGGSGSVS